MNYAIKKAIRELIVISFVLAKDSQVRQVFPTKIGTLQNGNEAMEAYLVGGYSESGNPSPFRLFLLDDITDIQYTPFTFKPNEINGYNRYDKRFSSIEAAI